MGHLVVLAQIGLVMKPSLPFPFPTTLINFIKLFA